MKKRMIQAAILFLASVYLVVAGIVSTGVYSMLYSLEEERYCFDTPGISDPLFCTPFSSDKTLRPFSVTGMVFYKPGIDDLYVKVKRFGEIIKKHYSQYKHITENLYTHYRIPDFVFPFHYFW